MCVEVPEHGNDSCICAAPCQYQYLSQKMSILMEDCANRAAHVFVTWTMRCRATVVMTACDEETTPQRTSQYTECRARVQRFIAPSSDGIHAPNVIRTYVWSGLRPQSPKIAPPNAAGPGHVESSCTTVLSKIDPLRPSRTEVHH
jgi:hypothetical protein